MTLEINTTRAIGAKFCVTVATYQEFSSGMLIVLCLRSNSLPDLRRQDSKNRQNSIDDLDEFIVQRLQMQMQTLFSSSMNLYHQMLDAGVAKEVQEMCFLCVPTRLYMSGSVRSWIHWIDLRSANGTQKEHMLLGEGARAIFKEQFPTVSEALEW